MSLKLNGLSPKPPSALLILGCRLFVLGGLGFWLVACGGARDESAQEASATADPTPTPYLDAGTRAAVLSLTGQPALTETVFAGSRPAAVPSVLLPEPPLPPPNLEPMRLGAVSVERIVRPHSGAASRFSSARLGDYVLQNEHVTLIFASVEPEALKPGVPPRPEARQWHRPGALIDVMIEGDRMDFLTEFTQGVGLALTDPMVEYGRAEFVQRDKEVRATDEPGWPRELPAALGLRLAGWVPGAADTRIETTYWLAAGERRVHVESRLAGPAAAAVELADVGDWGGGAVLLDKFGLAPGGTGLYHNLQWYAVNAGYQTIGVSASGEPLRGFFHERKSRVQALGETAEATAPLLDRWLFFARGDYADATDQIFEQAGPEWGHGVLAGRVVDPRGEPVADSWVTVLWYERSSGQPLDRRPFTRIRTDREGHYRAALPEGRYFVVAGARSRFSARPEGGVETGIRILPGQEERKALYLGPPARLRLKVADSRSKRTLPARVQLTPLGVPAENTLFRASDSALGYYDSFYVPPQGAVVELYAGRWLLRVSHGPRYDAVEREIDLAWETDQLVLLELPETSPTPGWIGLEIGAMTRATPDCAVSDLDAVLMAAAEGAEWIVSGDWERLTDLAPAIARSGLAEFIGSSRGFRTWHPSRPDWGTFLIYPVAADALDPAQARAQWYGAADSFEFVAALRSLYPGALIETVNPYSDRDGYFFLPGKNSAQMGYDEREEPLELDIDAVNLFEPHGYWSFVTQKTFYFANAHRGRWYLPAPVSVTRAPLASEPGYPRLLARTGETRPARLSETQVFEALRTGQWQLTSGPFVDLTLEGSQAGDVLTATGTLKGSIRVTAPSWVRAEQITVCKEGVNVWKEFMVIETESNERYRSEFDLEMRPQEKRGKDTAVNAIILGAENLDPVVPAYGGPGILSLAMTGPIIVDTNGNGVWDPPRYEDKGI